MCDLFIDWLITSLIDGRSKQYIVQGGFTPRRKILLDIDWFDGCPLDLNII